MINKVNNIDFFEGIKKLKDDNIEVDCVITDPPYNVSVDNNFHTMKGRQGIDFGEWDKNFDVVGWIKPMVDVVKTGGNIVIFNSWQNMSYIKDELERLGCEVKQMIIWRKTNPMPRNRDRLYVNTCEFGIWAVKGRGWTFNRQRETYENAIFEYPVVHHSKRYHKTQKPLELIEDLVKIHSNEGDLVLDCFMGSWTTAVASTKLGRNFVGFELDKGYCDKGEQRLLELIL